MSESIESAAARLRAAYTDGPIAPMRDILDPADGETAYAIQNINSRFRQSLGQRVIGRKIGLTAKAVQAQFGVDQPDYGTLFDTMVVEDGSELLASSVLQPKVEGEVAVVLERDIDNPEATLHDVMSAVAYVLPAIEIVDSRFLDWKITFADTVADNASAAFFVPGRTPRGLAGLDLWTCGMALEVNGTVQSLGAGAACLGHPLKSAAWLVRTLCRLGEPLRAGDVLMTGALGPMVAIKPGDVVRVSIGGLGSTGFVYREDRA